MAVGSSRQPDRPDPWAAPTDPGVATGDPPVTTPGTDQPVTPAAAEPSAYGARGCRADRRTSPKRDGPLAFLRQLPALHLLAFILAPSITSLLVPASSLPPSSSAPTL